MTKQKVVVCRKPPGPALERLFEQCDVWMWEEDNTVPRELLLEKVHGAEGLYTMLFDQVNQELLDAAPQLKVVSTMAVGVDNIDLAACTARGIPVGHTPIVVTEATADFAMALMLAASRRIFPSAEFVRNKQWKEWSPTLMIANDVHRKTLGIVGMGRIGQAIARRARGFDMNLLYHARSPKPEAERDLGVSYRALDDLLAESDIVILILPLTEETRHMINDETLAKMKPSAYLINSARGPIVDPDALYRALSEGRLAGAALDVTEPEPISADDPLLSLENCLIVPHISTSTWETRAMMTEVSVTNLLNGLQGKPLMHC
ncbi:MAG: D-glycerate dehydrogenase, partial [SAR324 cluster bacterium]|nr:D-glycerate dehydrogenase [SAR324 cluster bacterium]